MGKKNLNVPLPVPQLQCHFPKCQPSVVIYTQEISSDGNLQWELLKIGGWLELRAPVSNRPFKCFSDLFVKRRNVMLIWCPHNRSFLEQTVYAVNIKFFFSLLFVSLYCLSKSNYVCIRLSTGLFLCKTMEIFVFPISHSLCHSDSSTQKWSHSHTADLELGPERPLQKEKGQVGRGSKRRDRDHSELGLAKLKIM